MGSERVPALLCTVMPSAGQTRRLLGSTELVALGASSAVIQKWVSSGADPLLRSSGVTAKKRASALRLTVTLTSRPLGPF